MAEFNFGGVVEEVITSDDFSLQKAREILANETVAVLGYGVQVSFSREAFSSSKGFSFSSRSAIFFPVDFSLDSLTLLTRG